MNHDIVAIGASTGGVQVLLDMAKDLPADLAAAVFIVVHSTPGRPSALPELLRSKGKLDARHPLHDEPIRPGTIYVAPPDMQLQLKPGAIEVIRGPRDNGHRPAVDTLFRTASSAYGGRVIGVVLSGYLNCGTAGMMSIKARGGIGVVQDPKTAAAPDMPESVLAHVAVDHVVHPAELPGLLARLVATPAGSPAAPDPYVKQLEGSERGDPTDVVCPICQGVLTETQPGVFQHFRCHVGHAFTLENLVEEQGEEMERALWAAVRSLEESSALARRIGAREKGEVKRRFEEKATTHMQYADYIRQLLLRGQMLSRDDAKKLA